MFSSSLESPIFILVDSRYSLGVILRMQVRATYPYMSPEQLDHVHSEEGDIYSLGATLFYMITGKDPITTRGLQRDMHLVWQTAHKEQDRPNPMDTAKLCNPRLALLIMRMMSVNKKDRPDISECIAEIRKIIESDQAKKFDNYKPSHELEESLKSNNLPIFHTADFNKVFKPEVHSESGTNYFVFQIEMKHPVYIQYRSLIENLTSFFSDSFSLYETWGSQDVIIMLWSNAETVKKFEESFKARFYDSEITILAASTIHHFPSEDFTALTDPQLVYALAIQENKKVPNLTEDLKKEYSYRDFPKNVPENSVRAFTFVEATERMNRFRSAIISSVKEEISKLVSNTDPRDKKRCIRKVRVIEFNKDQSKILLVDFVAKNYRFLTDIPTQIIEQIGQNAIKTSTFLETRRVVFQSDKILF